MEGLLIFTTIICLVLFACFLVSLHKMQSLWWRISILEDKVDKNKEDLINLIRKILEE